MTEGKPKANATKRNLQFKNHELEIVESTLCRGFEAYQEPPQLLDEKLREEAKKEHELALLVLDKVCGDGITRQRSLKELAEEPEFNDEIERLARWEEQGIRPSDMAGRRKKKLQENAKEVQDESFQDSENKDKKGKKKEILQKEEEATDTKRAREEEKRGGEKREEKSVTAKKKAVMIVEEDNESKRPSLHKDNEEQPKGILKAKSQQEEPTKIATVKNDVEVENDGYEASYADVFLVCPSCRPEKIQTAPPASSSSSDVSSDEDVRSEAENDSKDEKILETTPTSSSRQEIRTKMSSFLKHHSNDKVTSPSHATPSPCKHACSAADFFSSESLSRASLMEKLTMTMKELKGEKMNGESPAKRKLSAIREEDEHENKKKKIKKPKEEKKSKDKNKKKTVGDDGREDINCESKKQEQTGCLTSFFSLSDYSKDDNNNPWSVDGAMLGLRRIRGNKMRVMEMMVRFHLKHVVDDREGREEDEDDGDDDREDEEGMGRNSIERSMMKNCDISSMQLRDQNEKKATTDSFAFNFHVMAKKTKEKEKEESLVHEKKDKKKALTSSLSLSSSPAGGSKFFRQAESETSVREILESWKTQRREQVRQVKRERVLGLRHAVKASEHKSKMSPKGKKMKMKKK
eukprot:756425-Hanusia_phi.AAC.1